MLGTGTYILDTIPLCVPCQLSQFCNGSWAIRRKENSSSLKCCCMRWPAGWNARTLLLEFLTIARHPFCRFC
jgi:hypothetical protein